MKTFDIDEFNERFQKILTEQNWSYRDEKHIIIPGAVSFQNDGGNECSWLFDGAKRGLIGHYSYLNFLTDSTVHIFYEKGNRLWSPIPMLITIDKQKIPVEFGKIKKDMDAEDLRKSGILQGQSEKETARELEIICNFIKGWIIKSKDDLLARKTLRTLFKKGIVISVPMMLSTRFAFSVGSIKCKQLHVSWKDFICPRCDNHFRVIHSDSVIAACPKCRTKFGTKS
jgi:hypothetical protein